MSRAYRSVPPKASSPSDGVSKKRRPDRRKIRDTKTYTPAELAEAAGKSVATIYDWLAQGLPAADSVRPALIFGWQARDWLAKKWDDRRHTAQPGTLYCMGCHKQTCPRQDSVRVVPRSGGGLNIVAACDVCGTLQNRGTKPEDIAAFQDAVARQKGEVERFIESESLPDNPGSEPDSNTPVDSNNLIAPSSARQRTDRLPRNARNERLKRDFFEDCAQAEGYSETSIRKFEIAILCLDTCFEYRDFGAFTKADAIAFKTYIRALPLTPATMVATMSVCRRFLTFLAERPGFKRKIRVPALRYLNLTMKERRAIAPLERIIPSPTPAEVDRAIQSIPHTTMIERRDRAAVVALALTGTRVGALVTLRLKHVDFELGGIFQPATEVKTKFSKSQTALFVPFYPSWLAILAEWVSELRTAGFGDDDPLFPRSAFTRGKTAKFGHRQLSREFMTSTQMTSNIVPKVFMKAGLPRYTSHAFRHMMNKMAYQDGTSLPVAKAISDNLGHRDINITNRAYGKMTLEERRDFIRRGVVDRTVAADPSEVLDQIMDLLKRVPK